MIRSPFRQHWLIPSGHLQTIAGLYLPSMQFDYVAESWKVDVSDNDQVTLHVDDVPEPEARTVVLVHGLCGCHLSPYMVRVAGKLHQQGLRAVRIDMRGWGQSIDARQVAHAGRSDDLHEVIAWLAEKYPRSQLTLVGFSLGGNQVLKLAGEVGEQPPGNLDSVISIAAPIDLMHCTKNIQTGVNRIYDRNFVRLLATQVQERQKKVPELRAYPVDPRPSSLYEFDDRITAPLAGFTDARDYYIKSSSSQFLPSIRIPTWMITADNDPLVPVSMYHKYTHSSAVNLSVTRGGGHLGFIAHRRKDDDRRWLDWQIVDWIRRLS